MSQKDDAIKPRKRSLFERPVSESLLHGRGTSKIRHESSPAIHQPTTQNSITPATVRRPALPLTNAAGVHQPSTTPQEQCQTLNQAMYDFSVSTKITESSTWAENQCDELNKFIVAEKERLEADAKSRLKIDIELRCHKPLRSIDSLLINQFDALEIQNQRLNTRLSTMSKERNDACNKLNRQMAGVSVLETQLAEQRNLSEQAMHDRNNAQSKLTVAVDEIKTLSTTLQSNEQRFSEQQQRVDHYRHQAEQAQSKLNVAVGDINTLRTTLQSNEQQIANLQLQLKMTLQKHDDLEDEKETADAQAVLAQVEMNRMEFVNIQCKKSIDTLTNDIASLKSQLSASNESMDNVSIRLTEMQQQLSVMTGERDKALMELGMATSKHLILRN
jgi:chromosome segregation ATPase